MKKITLILILSSFFSLNTFGQKLTVNELINLIDYNSDELDTYLVKKGFVFRPGIDSNNEDTKLDCNYFYEYSHKVKSYYDFAIFQCKYNNYQSSINFRTPSSNDNLLFKTELKNNGFKFINAYDDDNIHFINYELIITKYVFKATLASRTIDENETIYELSIDRINK